MRKLKSENLATGVIVLEWLMTVGHSIGLICYLKYLGDRPELVDETNLNLTTVLVWGSLFAIAVILLFIFLSILLTKGIKKQCTRHLSLWVIIQYIVFVVTFIGVVANMIGYLNIGWFWILLIVSLIYRFFILKIISEFNQEIGMERDKERRRSMIDLRQSVCSSTSTLPTPAKLTQNNLIFHNSQYIPVPASSPVQLKPPPPPPPPVKHYIPPVYNTRSDYVPMDQLPVATISVPAHRPPVPFRLGLFTRSFSESSV